MKKQLIQMIILSALMMKGTAQALPTLGRSVTGIVQQVDVKTREVEMRRDDKGTPLKFVWTKRTVFQADSRPADAGIIKIGAHITVRYHEPFFGNPFASRAKLLQTQVLEPASKTPSK